MTDLLAKVPRVANSPKAPCRMQREVAAQNAWFEQQKTSKDVTFKAPCDIDAPAAGGQPKGQEKPVAARVPEGLDAEIEWHRSRPRPEVDRERAGRVGLAPPDASMTWASEGGRQG